jgi:hypothetical protein
MELFLPMIPSDIENQVRKVAAYYALNLPRTSQNETPDTPEWLTEEAQLWIRRHHFEFSDLVVAARQETVNQGDN